MLLQFQQHWWSGAKLGGSRLLGGVSYREANITLNKSDFAFHASFHMLFLITYKLFAMICRAKTPNPLGFCNPEPAGEQVLLFDCGAIRPLRFQEPGTVSEYRIWWLVAHPEKTQPQKNKGRTEDLTENMLANSIVPEAKLSCYMKCPVNLICEHS